MKDHFQPRISSDLAYLACPMWEASYTVGPQQYHVTLFPF